MKGIDVSYHNGVINWAKVRESVDFAIVRAGYGKSTMDKQFINNIQGALAAGLKVGVYWFIYAANEAESVLNAQKCAELVFPYKDSITMKVWADWEYDSDKRNPQTKDGRTAIVRAFCNCLIDMGYEAGVYSNVDYLTSKFGNLSDYPLWLAKYSSDKGGYNPFMWQNSSTGKIPGISGNVDMNIYYGNVPDAGNSIKAFSLKSDGETLVSENFKVREFRCKDGSDKILVDTDFVKTYLQAIRSHFKAPVTVNSGYRTPEYNKRVNGDKNSYHIKGQAFDIAVKGYTPQEVARYAESLGVKGIIQYETFVHVDSRDVKYWAISKGGKRTPVSHF